MGANGGTCAPVNLLLRVLFEVDLDMILSNSVIHGLSSAGDYLKYLSAATARGDAEFQAGVRQIREIVQQIGLAIGSIECHDIGAEG